VYVKTVRARAKKRPPIALHSGAYRAHLSPPGRWRGYQSQFDRIIDIAGALEIGAKTVEKPNGTEITTGDMVEHRRLQIEARKWILAKALPKVYGDRIEAEHRLMGADDKPVDLLTAAQRNAFLLTVGVQQAESL
jgi:hypothetical protein